ncbi:MAG: hypothetical protein ABIJ61_04905 [bacterium]
MISVAVPLPKLLTIELSKPKLAPHVNVILRSKKSEAKSAMWAVVIYFSVLLLMPAILWIVNHSVALILRGYWKKLSMLQAQMENQSQLDFEESDWCAAEQRILPKDIIKRARCWPDPVAAGTFSFSLVATWRAWGNICFGIGKFSWMPLHLALTAVVLGIIAYYMIQKLNLNRRFYSLHEIQNAGLTIGNRSCIARKIGIHAVFWIWLVIGFLFIHLDERRTLSVDLASASGAVEWAFDGGESESR